MDIKTLQYWHKLEHFYPYIVNEQTSPNINTFMINSSKSFDDLINDELPFGKAVRYYAVYLGLFQLDKALEALEQGLGKKMRFRDTGDDSSCYCKFYMSVDRKFNANSFKISSFPWAIHRVRDGKIIMDKWEDDFFQFEKDAFLQLKERKTEIDYDFLLSLRDWFASNMNWKLPYCNYWLRIDRVIRDSSINENVFDETEEMDVSDSEELDTSQAEDSKAEDMETDAQIKQNDLLNSFYIRDLERIIERFKKDKSSVGQGFKSYIEHCSNQRIDIEKDKDTLLALLSPCYLPKGKWPSNYGLRLMQQVDINAFLSRDPAYEQALFSVNGPPGTGKTTLLKDIIAAIIVDRAIQMCSLISPDDAFAGEVCKIKFDTSKGVYTNTIREIKPVFKQYGIFIASNNNGAVENVTHTLPSLSEIHSEFLDRNYHYFSEVSDLLLGEGKTWAMNAAPLGNKSNKIKFVDAFWPIRSEHVGYNFNRELIQKIKTISISDWEAAKKSFLDSLEAVQKEYSLADEAYESLKSFLAAQKEFEKLTQDDIKCKEQLVFLEKLLTEQNSSVDLLKREQENLTEKLADIAKSQLLFWIKKLLFPNAPAVKTYNELQNELNEQVQRLHKARDSRLKTEKDIIFITTELKKRQEIIEELSDRLLQEKEQLEAFKELTQSPLRLDAYFKEASSDIAGLSSPWGYEKINQCRSKLFLEAMALHKAFVENSKYLRENLDGFSKMLRGMIHDDKLREAAPVLLQSFMLIVPVVSTTFASVGSFLSHIPSQEIAYLFIDEAGQAMPQSAAGAIWRSRKVIAVGDPMQIEPVVTLHESVINNLSEYYKQNEIISSRYTSVQSLADLANKLGGYRTLTEENDLWIGAPLLVHNRCQRRVFDIANKIAYNEKMVYATKERQQPQCQWLHVTGPSQNGHYVFNQAEAVCDLILDGFIKFSLSKDESQRYPAIFIISPFRSVRSGVAAYYRKNLPALLAKQGRYVKKDAIRRWIRECIGTIHTFQGKETDTVILCLGVDSNGKNIGAVEWACERPNILNVAITRSKENLYIVGDKAIWGNKPYFKTALEICKDSTVM